MRLSWLWWLYRHPQKLRMLSTPTSSVFCLVLGLFTAIGTYILLEPSLLSLSTSTRVGSCGQSLQSSPLPQFLFHHSFQLNTFHSIPRFVLRLISKTIAHITQNPATDINPEQTSSWFSFVFFFFLDDIIFKASRVPHLPAEEFPPLADYDWAPHLVKKSFPVRFHTHIYYTRS